MSNEELALGGVTPPNNESYQIEDLKPDQDDFLGTEGDEAEAQPVFSQEADETPGQTEHKIGELVVKQSLAKRIAKNVTHPVKLGGKLGSAVAMDVYRPKENPWLTRASVPAGLLIEAATISKLTSFFSLPLAFKEAGSDPSLLKVGIAAGMMAGITPAWTWFSSHTINQGTSNGKRSQEVLRESGLPKAVKIVSLKNDNFERLSYDDDKSRLDNARHLGKTAFKRSLSSFFVVTPQIYNAIFENKSPEERSKLCNDIARWSALGAATVTAVATGTISALHDVAPGPATFAAHEMSNSLVYMGLMFAGAGGKHAFVSVRNKVSKLMERFNSNPNTEKYALTSGERAHHEDQDIGLVGNPLLGGETV